MADKRRPLSLNDRHYRLLQDFSAPSRSLPSNQGEEEGEETKPTMVKMEGRRRLGKASSKENLDDDDVVLQFSAITDFDSSPTEPVKEESKPLKVKLDGKRRLCKVVARDDAGVGKKMDAEEPKSSGLAEFDSPSLQPKYGSGNEGGGNEIRDILNDLSSKLEFLSINKKKAPPRYNMVDDCIKDGIRKERNPSSDKSSSTMTFPTRASSMSISPSDTVKKCEAIVRDDVDELSDERKLLSYSDRRNLITLEDSIEAECIRKSGSLLKEEKLRSVGRSCISRLRELEDDEDDDCLVLTGQEATEVKIEKLKSSGHPSKAVALDDHSDEHVSKDDGAIVLRGPRSAYKLPGEIARMLYPHQREGLSWLWSLHCQGKGGILGDDMGLGKTMQICSFLAGLFHSRLIRRVLVVAPKTLLSHWIKELSVVGLSEKTRDYYGTSSRAREYELQHILQDKGVLLTTYDIVRNNSKSLRGDNHFNIDDDEDGISWDYMILDEGHLIKNPSTQRAKSLLEIPSAHRIIVSGTPIQNNLKELWALFNFCCPGLLGDNKWFKEKYEYYILRGNDKNASDREKRIGSAVAKDLREHIRPFFLRRLKSEVFGNDDATASKLSKKTEIIVWLRLTTCQRQLYEAFLQSEIVLSAFDGSPLAALTILKKICDHPLLLTKRAAEDVLEGMDTADPLLNPEEAGVAERLAMHIADAADADDFQAKHDSISCKISFILSLLDNLIPQGHHVLIFSQTRKMLNLIQESLISRGYKFLRIDGTTKASDRMRIVDDFQEGNGAPVFLLTSQVGGLGLTLTKADRVIVVDPAWNPSTDNQSVDRAYRIGQKKDVIVYRLMTCGTVEEKIYRKQVYKGGLFKTATEHKEQIRYFSQQDLRELFSLPKQGFDVSLTQQQLHEEHHNQIKMDGALESHIRFLETQGIAGVSHHSLLFSKTAPVEVTREYEEEIRTRRATSVRHHPSSSESIVDGPEYVFKPKDANLNKKASSPSSDEKLTESHIREKLNRLSQILANQVTVSRLPDKGVKLEKQIAELNLELERIKTGNGVEAQVIDLDDISGQFRNVLNV